MKNDEKYIEIDPQFLFKIVGGVLIAAYLIFFIGNYNDRRLGGLMAECYEEIDQLWSNEQNIKKVLQELDEPNVEDFKTLQRLSNFLIRSMNDREWNIHQQLFVKRDGAFYLTENYGYACDEQLQEHYFIETQLDDINELLEKKENSIEHCIVENEPHTNYYGNRKTLYYILDFDPERTAILQINLNFY